MTLARFLELAPAPRPLGPEERYTVFLSYRSVNRPWVINLHDTLSAAGHTVFLDQRALVPGGSLARSIEEALEASQAGVLIWSRGAEDSAWVRDEYDVLKGRARREPGFHFVPVKLDDAPLPPFARTQSYIGFDAYPDGPNGAELLALLHGVVGQPLSAEALALGEELRAASRRAVTALEAARINGDAAHVIELFDAGGLAWEVSGALGARAIEVLSALGHPDSAISRARTLVARFPNALRPQQMLAHVLSRRGTDQDRIEAARILGALYADGARDPETLGLYARTFMDKNCETGKLAYLRRARDLYREGFELSRDDTYCGINAASRSFMLDTPEDRALGQALAAEVAALLPDRITPEMDYWQGATLANAVLMQGETERAIRLFEEAVDRFPGEEGSHRSTAEQMARLAPHLGLSETETRALLAAFEVRE